MKRLDPACQIAELNAVAWDLRDRRVSSLPPIDLRQECRDHIVHVAEFHLVRRIGDGNGQIVRNVVAKGCCD